jgi:hypothetical protein
MASEAGHPLGLVSLVHDQIGGGGQADIAAPSLVFAKAGLQPVDVAPVAALLVDAVGEASFTGRIAWSKDQPLVSSGRLTTRNLGFTSPVGPVTGFGADVVLTSLAPVVTASDQVATASLIDAFTPGHDAKVVFALDGAGLRIGSARVGIAGGEATLGPTLIPLGPEGGLIAGRIGLNDLDLGQLIAATSYADRIKANLVVDGALPFEADAKGFRLLKGQIATVKPGRISISREVLSGVETGEAKVETVAGDAVVAEAPATGAVEDIVYQAMENLAVDSMNATVESQASGRLGVLFSIQGHHDPAVAEQARLSIADLVRGRAFSRRIPLPKGTPIDLTLDTSLNFDELLKGLESSFETVRGLYLRSRSDTVQR